MNDEHDITLISSYVSEVKLTIMSIDNLMIIHDSVEDEDFTFPSYSEPGWVIVEITEVKPDDPYYRFCVENYAVDGSAFWINEGVGIQFWLDQYFKTNELFIGWWVIEDVVGYYSPGDGWNYDADETWEFSPPRPATIEEIKTLSVIPQKKDTNMSDKITSLIAKYETDLSKLKEHIRLTETYSTIVDRSAYESDKRRAEWLKKSIADLKDLISEETEDVA